LNKAKLNEHSRIKYLKIANGMKMDFFNTTRTPVEEMVFQ